MKKEKLFFTTLFALFLISFFMILMGYKDKKIMADTTCPYTDPSQCLDYYYKLEKDLSGQKSTLQKKLDQEGYNQLSLQAKITYMANLIAETEKAIQGIEVEIAAKNIEIKLLEEDIVEKEDSVSVMKQEIAVLEATVNQRVRESYKYSFLGPFDLLLDSKNFSNILRKTKYLIETRTQDIESLEDYSQKATALKKEEEQLSQQKTEVETKRTEIETEKAELAEQNTSLQNQVTEKNNLLAESKTRESQYLTQFNSVSRLLSETEKAEEVLMLQLYQTGALKADRYVHAGEVIGLDGHTGCAFGTHLHFSLLVNGYYKNPIEYINNGTLRYPMTGVVVTNSFSSQHYATDLVSTNSGNQNWDTYTVSYGICPIVDSILDDNKAEGLSNWNQAYLRGEGAKVYAAMDGYFTHRTDKYGANYGMIVSNDGRMVTYYVHLKY